MDNNPLLRIRLKLAYTQKEMALALNISESLVCKIEKGQRRMPSLTLVALSQLEGRFDQMKPPPVSVEDAHEAQNFLLEEISLVREQISVLKAKHQRITYDFRAHYLRYSNLAENSTPTEESDDPQTHQKQLEIIQQRLHETRPKAQMEALLELRCAESRLRILNQLLREMG